ncbi:MAG: DUF2599 domain-containing protein [Promicromonosporaceae bacterium]|nr:DUF2599 domain-containing protein [Promicromonosporaceae bacterium]
MKRTGKVITGLVVSMGLLAGCGILADYLGGSATGVAQRVRDAVPSNPTERIRNQLDTIPGDIRNFAADAIPDDLRNVAADVAARAGDLVSGETAPLPDSPAMISATWAYRADEGGRTLMVVPAQWVREAVRGTSLSRAQEATNRVWDEMIAAEPEANSQTMRDQLICHALGAPEKDSWNLEPWRPDVGLAATIAAMCNPN